MKRTVLRLSAISLIAPAVALLPGGCTHRATSGMEGEAATVTGPGGSAVVSKYVVVNNAKLAKGIQIVDLQTSFAANGLLQASVSVVSKHRKTLNFQYRFEWLDESGRMIDPEAGTWKPMVLYGNESRTIQGTAPNAAAREYRIKLRKN